MQEHLTGTPVSKPDDFIFATNNGKMRSYHGARHMFNRLLKKHGFEDAGKHFYKLRHTFSNTLFVAQENPKIIQMLMGQKKVEKTMIYNTATTNKYLQKAVTVFDERYFPQEQKAVSKPLQPPTETNATPASNEQAETMESRVASFMDVFGVSSLDELLEVFDETPKKKDY